MPHDAALMLTRLAMVDRHFAVAADAASAQLRVELFEHLGVAAGVQFIHHVKRGEAVRRGGDRFADAIAITIVGEVNCGGRRAPDDAEAICSSATWAVRIWLNLAGTNDADEILIIWSSAAESGMEALARAEHNRRRRQEVHLVLMNEGRRLESKQI